MSLTLEYRESYYWLCEVIVKNFVQEKTAIFAIIVYAFFEKSFVLFGKKTQSDLN